MKHITTAHQFTRPVVERLIADADAIRKSPLKTLTGSTIATLFYEPSTRTRLSFEAAAFKLGANVISTENAAMFSSAIKGETLEDTIRVVSTYCDAIVLRHPDKGAAKRATDVSAVPIINAGDGTGEHPTQALLDVYTVQRELGRVDDLHFCLVGDLRNGRTIHSLIYLLGLYKGIKITLVSLDELSLPREVVRFMTENGIPWHQTDSLPKAIQQQKPDVIYMTRLQKERMAYPLPSVYTLFHLTTDLMKGMKEESIVMHPLPRNDELVTNVDSDPRAAYFRQAENGLWMRAAVLRELLA